MGLASGIAYLDCAHIRGAYGLSGIGILPTAAELDEQFLSPVAALHARELLPPPPQPAITNTNMNIRAPIIFSIKSPFAGTVIETDRPCPQLGNWPYLAEAGGGKGADGRRLTYWRNAQGQSRNWSPMSIKKDACRPVRGLRIVFYGKPITTTEPQLNF
jgi:hypothetical protein